MGDLELAPVICPFLDPGILHNGHMNAEQLTPVVSNLPKFNHKQLQQPFDPCISTFSTFIYIMNTGLFNFHLSQGPLSEPKLQELCME